MGDNCSPIIKQLTNTKKMLNQRKHDLRIETKETK